ncbi:uncharacterized protein NMK_3379 [Novimethylophilus kurashikiensis]|uniref:Phosphate-starvation-inducible E n=1 Tax=Novimethylophilus kurashikiensis TaxID=1825523 RepID=A0A2R5FC20_9PROT|nr:phosphate-starvation-inducible PsiE family protein [Novimethylophilus kurashikiensis]GBG15767.1 uncharacterized protein NMK_3379 [Novimethylophilus kurashikiensis]
MNQDHFPEELNVINRFAIQAMLWLNGIAHLIIGLALAVSVLMFTWVFFQDVHEAATAHNLVHGFLHALGTLMLLWTISALITAEIRYLRGSKLEIDTFVEVAMVVMVRKLIVLPVQDSSPSWEEVMMWVGGALLLGLMFLVVRWSQCFDINGRGTPRRDQA